MSAGKCFLLLLQKQDAGGNEQKESLLQLLVKNVLKNPYIWGMALTYFFIYVVRQGVTSWFVFYLMKVLSFHSSWHDHKRFHVDLCKMWKGCVCSLPNI